MSAGVPGSAKKLPVDLLWLRVRPDAASVCRMVLPPKDLRDRSGGVGQNCYRYPPTDTVLDLLSYHIQ